MSLFVTIEGIEGSGKSTLRSKLAELFTKDEQEILVTREPGATQLGLAIRSLLLDPNAKEEIDPLAELMLFAADRAQHLKEVVRPALARGAIVICDRFIHSTLAYQGYGRGLALDALTRLNALVTDGLVPDLVLLLDLDPEVGLQRARNRQERASGTIRVDQLMQQTTVENTWSRFEQQELAFHQRVREGFLALAKNPDQKFFVIDAAKGAEAVQQEAMSAIRTRLSASKR